MKNTINKVVLGISGSLLITLTGCGSGHNASSTEDPKSSAPIGTISYNQIKSLFQAPSDKKVNAKQLNSTAYSCENPMQKANWDLSFVKLFTSFIPGPAGTAINTGLGLTSNSLSIAGSLEGNSCQSGSTNEINQELQQQQQQINQIESTLALLENNFYVQNVVTEAAISGTDQYLYNQNFLTLAGNTNSGVDGSFQRFMIDSTLWNQYAQAQPQITVESIVANSQAISNLNDFIAANTNFTQLVTNLSGSQYNQNNCTINCYNTIESNPNSALILVYKSLYTELLNSVDVGINNQQNIVPLFDEYNQSIVAYYLQSVYALQEAYFMEQLINQINLYESQNPSVQLGSLGNVPGTWFSYNNYQSGESQGYYVTQYNNAQEQLALVYAARFNQLYINTISYIVSDKPKGTQKLPSLIVNYTLNGVESSDNLSEVYNNVSSAVATPMNILFSGSNALNSNISNSAFVYQFGGLNNVQTCESSLTNYNTITQGQGVLNQGLTPQNCPAIFQTSNGSAYNQSYYSGNSFQPYYASGTPILTQMIQNAMAIPNINGINVANSTAACKSNQNLYWYTPTNNTQYAYYVSCNLWQTNTDLIISSSYAPNWTMSQLSYKIPGPAGTLDWGYNNSVSFSELEITPVAADNWNNFNTTLEGNNNAMSGVSAQWQTSFGLAVGNMPESYTNGNPYSVHQMAFQTTTGDGFIVSFVLQFFNHAGWTGNYIGVTCNQMLNNVAFVNANNSTTPIQASCNQTTNNPSSVTVNGLYSGITIDPPTVGIGGEYTWNYYSTYNFNISTYYNFNI